MHIFVRFCYIFVFNLIVTDFLNKTECDGEATLFKNNLAMELKRPKEWRFVVVGRERGFFLCLGGSQIYKLSNGNWVKIKENMELMNNTLVYADLVDELYLAGAKQSSVTALHIVSNLCCYIIRI